MNAIQIATLKYEKKFKTLQSKFLQLKLTLNDHKYFGNTIKIYFRFALATKKQNNTNFSLPIHLNLEKIDKSYIYLYASV